MRDMSLCDTLAPRYASMLLGSPDALAWIAPGICVAHAFVSNWRGVGFGCDPPPLGWFPVAPGSRPYLFGMIVGAPRRGERISHTTWVMARARCCLTCSHMHLPWLVRSCVRTRLRVAAARAASGGSVGRVVEGRVVERSSGVERSRGQEIEWLGWSKGWLIGWSVGRS